MLSNTFRSAVSFVISFFFVIQSMYVRWVWVLIRKRKLWFGFTYLDFYVQIGAWFIHWICLRIHCVQCIVQSLHSSFEFFLMYQVILIEELLTSIAVGQCSFYIANCITNTWYQVKGIGRRTADVELVEKFTVL